MKPLKVLHLASFAGNIGDVENQRSFRLWTKQLLPEFEITWKDFEIRRFYRKEEKVHSNFFDSMRQSDLLVIGGGNFLELWPEDTPSGTSLPFSADELIDSGIPVFFNSLGVDNGQGVSDSSAEKFKNFINDLLSKGRIFLTVRNDGSMQTILPYLRNEHKARCIKLPDHGFFAFTKNDITSQNSTVLGINLAIDMPDIRFTKFNNSAELFLDEIAKSLEEISVAYPKMLFRLIPHMYSDLKSYSYLLERLNDQLRREKIYVSEYDVSSSSMSAFRSYNNLSMLIAMRFHSNVFGFSMAIPTMSVESYPQISKLLDEMNITKEERYLPSISRENLRKQIYSFIRDCMSEKRELSISKSSSYMGELNQKRNEAGVLIKKWILREVDTN